MGQAVAGVSLHAPDSGYLRHSLPVAIILGSFFALTLPLCALALSGSSVASGPVVWWYIMALGSSHFILTLTIYCQSDNLRYYASSWRNRVLYFVIPAAIFSWFICYRIFEVALLFPLFDIVFRSGIRLLDFQHFNRQSFGVSQLFKGRGRLRFPAWQRKVEEFYFFGLSLLLFFTFLLGGRWRGDVLACWLLAAGVAGLLVLMLYGYTHAWATAERRSDLLAPVIYLLLQSVCAALAIYDVALYGFCLAIHYVEYHVLMVPRCFHTRLDPLSRLDRIYGVVRRHRVVFYALILALAATVSLTAMGMAAALADYRANTSPVSYWALLYIFDGLFVFHYFIERLIWKFGDPYYRRTLGPLYFGSPARPAASA